MTLRTEPWPAGVPCWADIQVPDVPAAQAFYGSVLGWDFTEADDAFGGYVIALVNGSAAAGIGPIMGGATAWVLYLATDDIDKTTASVAEHGGTVLMAPGDVGDSGRLAVATDPTGAVFGLWQAGTQVGSAIVNEPGGITWEDLRTGDPDTARTFYHRLFGFHYSTMPGAPDEYTTFKLSHEDNPRGGIGPMFGDDGSPPHWLVYFAVADAAASVAAAEAGGGTVIMRDMQSPFGTMAAIADPYGAAFWIVETSGQA
jgi:uncharacterized protein